MNVSPHLQYCSSVWASFAEANKEVLENVQKRAIKMISRQQGIFVEKMPQSRLGSMQGKNTAKRNMSSTVCASSMNKSLDPNPI